MSEEETPIEDIEEGEGETGDDFPEVAATAGQAQGPPDKKKTKQQQAPEHPCLCCSAECKKNQAAVKCVMCALWAHKTCLKMPDTVFKSLDQQMKETGTAYWVCRPCQSFAQRVQHRFGENDKRHEATEKKVEENTKEIRVTKNEIEELRKEMKKLAEELAKSKEEGAERIYEELQERESRRACVVLHNVDEIPDSVRGNRERIERDKERCEEIFRTMKARTKKEDIRFCRRLGEKGEDPRPIVVGLETEEEKRHILSKAPNLQHTKLEYITVVQDLTKIQREKEEKLRATAKEKNKHLTEEERENNLKWLVVGRRGEK